LKHVERKSEECNRPIISEDGEKVEKNSFKQRKVVITFFFTASWFYNENNNIGKKNEIHLISIRILVVVIFYFPNMKCVGYGYASK
jgi:hypothetical protein